MAPTQGGASVVLASNRGPVSFVVGDDGQVHPRRGAGGLISGLSGGGTEAAVWVCAALSEGDRLAARAVPDGRLGVLEGAPAGVRMLDIDPGTFRRAYHQVANSTLWFVQHLLFDTAREPVFDERFAREWESYVAYNEAFAVALAEEAGPRARVLVQDYHLMLVPGMLRAKRRDVAVGFFSHTPWAPPDYFRLLPDDVAVAVLEGVLGADSAGFLTARWAQAFAACCREVLDAQVTEDDGGALVRHHDRDIRLAVHPLGVDGPAMRERAHQADVAARLDALRAQVGDRRAIVRVDRTELSKNIVRGIDAFEELLVRHPEWREQVVHVALAYPSRHDLPVYREYTGAVQRAAERVNDAHGTASWQPVVLFVEDDLPRSLAAYQLADVLLVNPVRDGMNLVAKEGPVVNDHQLVLVLSREAGAAEEMGADALLVNPFDVTGTADALHAALLMPDDERAARAARLTAAATALPPEAWLDAQLADLSSG